MPRDLKARVLQYLESRRGERVFLTDIVTALEEGPRRIQNSLNFIKQQGTIPLTTVVKGHTWEVGVNPNHEVTPKVDNRNTYVEIVTLKSGAFLLQRQDGALFKADLTEVD